MGGQLFALLVIFGLQASMSEAAIRDWGWRLPFLLGAVLAGAFLLLRDLMHETAEPAGDGEEAGSLKVLARHPRALLTVMALSAAGSVPLYSFPTSMPKFLVNTSCMAVPTATRAVSIPTFSFLFTP